MTGYKTRYCESEPNGTCTVTSHYKTNTNIKAQQHGNMDMSKRSPRGIDDCSVQMCNGVSVWMGGASSVPTVLIWY